MKCDPISVYSAHDYKCYSEPYVLHIPHSEFFLREKTFQILL